MKNFCLMGVLNNCNILPVDSPVGTREPYEKIRECSKMSFQTCPEALEGKAAALGRAEHTKEYVSTAKGRPARLRVEALQRVDAKPLRRRHGGIFQHSLNRNAMGEWCGLQPKRSCVNGFSGYLLIGL